MKAVISTPTQELFDAVLAVLRKKYAITFIEGRDSERFAAYGTATHLFVGTETPYKNLMYGTYDPLSARDRQRYESLIVSAVDWLTEERGLGISPDDVLLLV